MNYGFYYGFNIASSNECEMKSMESTLFQNRIFNFQKKIISQNMYTFQSIMVYWM